MLVAAYWEIPANQLCTCKHGLAEQHFSWAGAVFLRKAADPLGTPTQWLKQDRMHTDQAAEGRSQLYAQTQISHREVSGQCSNHVRALTSHSADVPCASTENGLPHFGCI